MKIELTQIQSFPNGVARPRTIRLVELHQSFVYEGLLEGLPTREMNLRHLQRVSAQAHQKFPFVPVEPYLIAAVETPIEYHRERPYPFGEPARLPAIQCFGRWESYEYGDPAFDYSTLAVVWFQQEFALPIDENIISSIREIDWEKVAHKGEH